MAIGAVAVLAVILSLHVATDVQLPAWVSIALALGAAVGLLFPRQSLYCILAFVYLAVITPMSWVRRLAGAGITRSRSAGDSYWISKQQDVDFEKLYRG